MKDKINSDYEALLQKISEDVRVTHGDIKSAALGSALLAIGSLVVGFFLGVEVAIAVLLFFAVGNLLVIEERLRSLYRLISKIALHARQ